MELRQLKYFIQVAESLNFTEASKKLFITQSTISQQIKQLEEELNVLLFDRSEKQICLTEAGLEFLPHAVKVIQDAEYGKQRLLDLQNIRTGELTIGVNYSFSGLLKNTVVKFLTLYPNIKLNILYKTVSELIEMVRKREVDFVLSYKPVWEERSIESMDLFKTHLSVIVHKNHPLSKSKRISIDEIKQYPLALPSKGLHARSKLDASLYANRTTLHPKIELNEANILLQLVETGDWITILSSSTIFGQKNFKAIPLAGDSFDMQAALLWIRDSYQKFSAKEFIKIMLEEECYMASPSGKRKKENRKKDR
ncbi:LysR family transcriptional regulator [Puteibacter caeruleilacunae]|nr:LysR family transcriptional regulator [Puteibacter caeruleilacunae]